MMVRSTGSIELIMEQHLYPSASPATEEADIENGRGKINILRRSEVFLGLSDEDLRKIVKEVTCTVRTFQVNEMVFEVGDAAPELLIVEEGKIDLVLSHRLPEMQSRIKATIDTVCTGGTFGWSSLIAPYTYTLAARCVEAARVLALNGNELTLFLDRQTAIGYEIMKTLNRIVSLRLRDSNRALFHIIASSIKV